MTGQTVVGVEVLRGLQAHLAGAVQVALRDGREREVSEYLQSARLLARYSEVLQSSEYLAPSLLWSMSREVETAGDRANRGNWEEVDTLDTVASGLAALAEFLERSADGV